MKKMFLVLLILLGIGVILGVVGIIVVASKGGFEGEKLELLTKTESYSVNETVTVDSSISNIYVKKGDVDQVVFEYYQGKNRDISILHENGKIVLKERQKLLSIDLSFFRKKSTITVTLPSNFSGDLNLNATTGELNADLDGFNIKDLTIGVTTGTLNLSNASVSGEIEAEISTGAAKINNIKAQGNVEIECTTGSLSIKDVDVKGDLELKSTTGRIKIESALVGGKTVGECSTGEGVYQLDCREVHLKSTTGTIKIRLKNAHNVKVVATTGDITGVVYGNQSEYSIDYSTSTGYSNLPRTNKGEKTFYARTTTGNINVDFE